MIAGIVLAILLGTCLVTFFLSFDSDWARIPFFICSLITLFYAVFAAPFIVRVQDKEPTPQFSLEAETNRIPEIVFGAEVRLSPSPIIFVPSTNRIVWPKEFKWKEEKQPKIEVSF
jgi:hypothetical protein